MKPAKSFEKFVNEKRTNESSEVDKDELESAIERLIGRESMRAADAAEFIINLYQDGELRDLRRNEAVEKMVEVMREANLDQDMDSPDEMDVVATELYEKFDLGR